LATFCFLHDGLADRMLAPMRRFLNSNLLVFDGRCRYFRLLLLLGTVPFDGRILLFSGT